MILFTELSVRKSRSRGNVTRSSSCASSRGVSHSSSRTNSRRQSHLPATTQANQLESLAIVDKISECLVFEDHVQVCINECSIVDIYVRI